MAPPEHPPEQEAQVREPGDEERDEAQRDNARGRRARRRNSVLLWGAVPDMTVKKRVGTSCGSRSPGGREHHDPDGVDQDRHGEPHSHHLHREQPERPEGAGR